MNGGITDHGAPIEWNFFLNSRGLRGEWRCRYPAYEGFGIFTGHPHGFMHTAEGRVPRSNYEYVNFETSSLDQYNDGSLRDDGLRPKWKDSGRFLVVHITDTRMTVIMNTPHGGRTPHSNPISPGPEPAAPSTRQSGANRAPATTAP